MMEKNKERNFPLNKQQANLYDDDNILPVDLPSDSYPVEMPEDIIPDEVPRKDGPGGGERK